MKLKSFLLLIPVIILSGCKKDNMDNNGGGMIWDITPIVVSVSVVDAQGNDLLDPQTPNAFDLTKIRATCEGKSYDCQDLSASKTKAYLAHFDGLKTFKSDYFGSYILTFGEFTGDAIYKNKTVIFVWPDGSSDKISFNRDFKWKSNGEPEVKQEWFLNGSKVEYGLIKIVK